MTGDLTSALYLFLKVTLFFISSRPKELHANTQSLIVISRGCVESDADSDSLFGVAGRAEIDPSISIALCHVPGFSQLVEALSCDPAEVPDGDYCKRYITSCQGGGCGGLISTFGSICV